MLRPIETLKRMTLHASDGDIGSVKDILFDDERWVVRYLVIDTRKWLPGRKVLVSPYSVSAIDWDDNEIDLSITREQLKNSPEIDADQPVSRQREAELLDYYQYPYYWGGMLAWGTVAHPIPAISDAEVAARRKQRTREQAHADPHLRSADEVSGYRIDASDGEIGHVEDFLVEESSWALQYVVVDTRNWLPGRHVVVATEWVDKVSWNERSVRVDLTRQAVKDSPEWTAERMFTSDDERTLYRHHGRVPPASFR